jgi:hypothetical protein
MNLPRSLTEDEQRTRLTNKERWEPMVCRKHGNPPPSEFRLVCDECLSKNPPTRIYDSPWVVIGNLSRIEKKRQKPTDNELRDLILTSFDKNETTPDRKRNVIVVGGRLEVPVEENGLDDLARKTGIVGGKWLIHEMEEAINKSWYVIAKSTWKDELGTEAKVSSARNAGAAKEYVICVYTENYLDSLDVRRVRERLRELGYTQRLYYKPDLYTYLNIYHKTFPTFRASRYAD